MIDKTYKRNLLIFLMAALLIGCAGSAPRFKSKDTPQKQKTKITKEHRFASKAAKEEAAEDDRKVEISSVREKILSSSENTSLKVSARDKVLTEVLSMLGTPYSYGGNDNNGIDCSSFSSVIYEKSFGIKLPRSTDEQYKSGKNVSQTGLTFGDLVFFNTTGKSPSHVGIYLGDDLFAHASLSFGVTISSMQSTYYKKRYIGARRIVE